MTPTTALILRRPRILGAAVSKDEGLSFRIRLTRGLRHNPSKTGVNALLAPSGLRPHSFSSFFAFSL